MKDLKIIDDFLTSLRTWGSPLNQFFTLKFEIFGLIGSCCKISIDMVGDYCWLVGNLKDLLFLSDMLCFETLMMKAFYRRCCMQQGKENKMEGVCDLSSFLSHSSLSLLSYE